MAFTIRGLLRGTIAQVFAFLGLFLGIWATSIVAHWIGEHWHNARPAVFFAIMHWLVAGLAGLAVASLFQWWGEQAGAATHKGPLGGLDRLVGGCIGFAFGLGLAAVLVVFAVQSPFTTFARPAARQSRYAGRLVGAGERLTARRAAWVPGGDWLHGQFASAARRIGHRGPLAG